MGLSRDFAKEILDFLEYMEDDKMEYEYTDMIIEYFSEKFPANIVRYDLESYIRGHRGVFFQDRKRFPSIIKPENK
jgi:hypothetical protein